MEEKKFVPVMTTPLDLKANRATEMISVLVVFYLEAGAKGSFANCLMRKNKCWITFTTAFLDGGSSWGLSERGYTILLWKFRN